MRRRQAHRQRRRRRKATWWKACLTPYQDHVRLTACILLRIQPDALPIDLMQIWAGLMMGNPCDRIRHHCNRTQWVAWQSSARRLARQPPLAAAALGRELRACGCRRPNEVAAPPGRSRCSRAPSGEQQVSPRPPPPRAAGCRCLQQPSDLEACELCTHACHAVQA